MPRSTTSPRDGAVSKSALDAFATNYRWKGSGVGNASRLLAMKRPDLLLCVDSKNRAGIAKAFGVSASSLQTFDGYWDLMQRIWRCPWNRAPRPRRALDRRVWDARVALLDLLQRQCLSDGVSTVPMTLNAFEISKISSIFLYTFYALECSATAGQSSSKQKSCVHDFGVLGMCPS